ncbi:MAG: hypothetical protein AB7I41_08210 [Candidatus Sericytochromatia bacterium]
MSSQHLKYLGALLIGGLLNACQLFSGSQAVSGALSLAVQFPQAAGFQIQTVAPETRAIYVMVYGNGLSLEKPQFWGPLTRFNPRMMVQGVPIGPQNVVVAAYDAQSKLISAANESVTVRGGTRTAVNADLQPNPETQLKPEELRALANFKPQIPAEPCGFSASGLQVAVHFPAFGTQMIKPETRQIYLVIYGSGLTLENPAVFGPMTPEKPRVVARNLPIGKQIVLTVAADEKGQFLTGDRQEVEIQAGQRASLNQDLREGFESRLSEAEMALLKRLTLPKLQRQAELTAEMPPPVCPTPTPLATPSTETVALPLVPKLGATPKPTPEPTAKPTPQPSPELTPTPSPSPTSNSSSSGGGGSAFPTVVTDPTPTPTPTPTPVGASLNVDVNITNGTVGIPPITAF